MRPELFPREVKYPAARWTKKGDMAPACCGIFDKARVLEVTSCPAVPAACRTVFHEYSAKLNVGLSKGFVNARVRLPPVSRVNGNSVAEYTILW